MKICADLLETAMERILAPTQALEAQVIDAMRYSSLGGGKRIRPFLVLQSANLFGVGQDHALQVGAALELVHCYSLVHDDLPAMDDDDLRRGQPTTHKKYDEATAILAGDGLLTLAFEVLADQRSHENAEVRCELISELAKAAGGSGMVGGQMIDLNAEKQTNILDIAGITRLQQLKTGRLINYGCLAGAILGQAEDTARAALRGYSHDLGLAFQIADDLLDVEGNENEMGKAVGKDAKLGKATFVSILGVEQARAQAQLLAQQAVDHLGIFDHKADLLRAMAYFVVERRH